MPPSVPATPAGAERGNLAPAAAARLAGLVTAAWVVFDEIVAASPAGLRKGPRGGGRDRDQVIGHVLAADTAYARKLGIKLKRPALGDVAATGELRTAIAAVVSAASDGSPVVPGGWTTSYAARRIGWHVLEHAWEMQDRAETQLARRGERARPGRQPATSRARSAQRTTRHSENSSAAPVPSPRARGR
jgi:hypothetical protein